MKSIIEKHEQLFTNINESVHLKQIQYFQIYTQILLLQINGLYIESLRKSFELRNLVKEGRNTFNPYYCQLVMVKIIENLFISRKFDAILINWNQKFLQSNSQLHQFIDLKVLQVWCLYHAGNNGKKPFKTIFNKLQLFSLEQANSFLSIHYYFKSKKFSRAIEAIRLYFVNKMHDNSNWLMIQLITIEFMTLIELRRFDSCEVKYKQFEHGLLRTIDLEIKDKLEFMLSILKSLNQHGYQFSHLPTSLTHKIKSTIVNSHPKSIQELYST